MKHIVMQCTVLLALSMATSVYADGLGDPMRPLFAPSRLNAPAAAAPAQRLTAIFVSDDRRVAVIDGRVVKPGDRIGDAVVQDVMPDGARIARNGRVEVLRLPKQAAEVRAEKGERKASVVKETSP